MRYFVAVMLALLPACAAVLPPQPIRTHARALEPDIVAPMTDIPIWLKGTSLLREGQRVAHFIDAVQMAVEEIDPSVPRGPVVVYPHRSLWDTEEQRVYQVTALKPKGSDEVKVEWWPGLGAKHFALMRLRQAGWAVSTPDALERTSDEARKATAAGLKALRTF